jgi:adenosylcobinamide-phosphate synthase
MDELIFCAAGALGIDFFVGDPRWLPHPVRLIGTVAISFERFFSGLFGRNRFSGFLFTGVIVGGTFLAVWGILALAESLHHWLALGLTVYFLYTAFAARDLDKESRRVFRSLARGDLEAARKNLSMIVGRDTGTLNEREIVRGTVETIAEGTVDGVLSPLVFAILGGAPLALAYKAVNTLDSMVGYRNERYLDFGWASARLDDLLNFVPARLARLLYPAASLFCGLNASRCWAISMRDGRKSPSPNAAISEAALAGALGVQLGGVNFYQGEAETRPHLGDPLRELEPGDIRRAIRWMYTASALGFVLLASVRALVVTG